MKENEGQETLSINEAKAYYDKLEKALHPKDIYRYFP